MNDMSATMTVTSKYPELGGGPTSIERYTSQAYFEKEREKIFKKCWLNVADSRDIPNPGDYVTQVLPTFDLPLLIMRGKDGRVRAFYNVCVHRQFPVMLEKKGSCSGQFACKMHGWVYDTEGHLVKVIDDRGYNYIQKDLPGLKEIACDVWSGFIFINLDEKPAVSLSEYLAPFTALLDGYPIDEMAADYVYSAYEDANWKQMIHGQSEAHHIPYLHKSTIAAEFGMIAAREIPPADFREFGDHRAIGAALTGDARFPEPKPTAAMSAQYGVGTIYSQNEKAGSFAESGVAWTREFGAGCSFNIFPNCQLILTPAQMIHTRFIPISVSRSIYEITGYSLSKTRPANAGQWFAKHYANVIIRDTFREDGGAAELVQKGLNSGAMQQSHYHDCEVQLRHLDHVVDRYLAD